MILRAIFVADLHDSSMRVIHCKALSVCSPQTFRLMMLTDNAL